VSPSDSSDTVNRVDLGLEALVGVPGSDKQRVASLLEERKLRRQNASRNRLVWIIASVLVALVVLVIVIGWLAGWLGGGSAPRQRDTALLSPPGRCWAKSGRGALDAPNLLGGIPRQS
jgi:hypothetical protein